MVNRSFAFERWWVQVSTVVLYFLLALVTTWPLALRPSDRLPMGSEPVLTVPMFNVWTIWWNAEQLASAGGNYWDSPIFFPAKNTFALSEPQPVTMVVAPVLWLTGSRVLAYNIYLLLGLTLNGWFAQMLLRYLRVGWPIAIGGGIAMLLLPVIHWQLGVLQLVPLWGILWTWLAFVKIIAPDPIDNQQNSQRAQTVVGLGPVKEILWRSTELAIAFSLAFFTSAHHALFLALLMVGGVGVIGRQLLLNRVWCKLLLAALLASLITLPVVLKLRALAEEPTFVRPLETVEQLSLRISDYGAVFGSTWLNTGSPNRTWWMSPGWLKLPLALLGVISGLALAERRRWTLFFTTTLLLAFVLSLGTHLVVFGLRPWLWLSDYVPGFGQVRSAFRFGYFVQILIVLLAAIGADHAWRWCSQRCRASTQIPSPSFGRSPLACRIIALGIVAWSLAAMCDPWPARSKLGVVPTVAKHHAWLDKLVELQPQAVLCLPMASGDDVRDFETTTDWMFLATYHGIPLANGYSGFFPPRYFELRDSTWQEKFDGEMLESFVRDGVLMLVIDRVRYRVDWQDDESLGQVRLRRVFQDEIGIDLYQLTLSDN